MLMRLLVAPCAAVLGACSSSSSSSDDAGVAVAMCSSPGEATPGPADMHCATAASDGGVLMQQVDLACNAPLPADDAGGDDGGGGAQCGYGPTMYGQEGDDDDCKYRIVWSSTPLCEQPGSVVFTVKATKKTDGSPLTGAGTSTEVFATTPGDQSAPTYCDAFSHHGSPSFGPMKETTPGTYVGTVAFDKIPADAGAPGAWTVRFHFFEGCTDLPNAPHGHGAFHVTVP
jgi:hypothetical protein